MPDTENPNPEETLDASQSAAPAEDADSAEGDNVTDEAGGVTEESPAAEKLQLEVKIEERSTCERHVCVTVSREDVDRYFDKEYSELMPTAQVPGFRPGHAPRKLVEKRFRKDLGEKVKASLLMDSLSQVSKEEDFSAISEPDVDLDAVEIPDEGPLTFEFDIEVRPEFDLPRWKGLSIERPVREIDDAAIDRTLAKVLRHRARLVPIEEPAALGDYVTADLTFRHEDEELATADGQLICIRPVLSFRDGKIEGFDELMVGVVAGDARIGYVELTEDAPNEALRGQKIAVDIRVLEVKRLELPELDEELLNELGGFDLEADLRDAVKDQLGRQQEYEQHQHAREQITAALTVSADWELPPDMLKRQSYRELQRSVMELQRSGFSDDEINAHKNRLLQNSKTATARALKEHFILERIAEQEKIEATEQDYENEIRLIAYQSRESARRVRARIEKSDSMDVLRNQIIERKVIGLILEHAEFQDVPAEPDEPDTEAINLSAGGRESDIPEAKTDEHEAAPGGRPAEPPTRG